MVMKKRRGPNYGQRRGERRNQGVGNRVYAFILQHLRRKGGLGATMKEMKEAFPEVVPAITWYRAMEKAVLLGLVDPRGVTRSRVYFARGYASDTPINS